MLFGIPLLPLLLGLAGLIPFWGLALAGAKGGAFGFDGTIVDFALTSYAATIASFLGGMRWGLAIGKPDQSRLGGDYLLSVVPQLVAWGALFLPGLWRVVVLALLILLLGPLDKTLVARGLAPLWFGRLRVILSIGAGAALLLRAIA